MYCGWTMLLQVRCRSRAKYLLQVMIGYIVMTTLAESYSDPICANSEMDYLCNPQNPASFVVFFFLFIGRHQSFYRCLPNGQKVLYICPGELHFNTANKACNWPRNADCSLPPTTPKRPVWDETVKKGPCNPKICRLPTCKCPGTEIPGSLNPKVVPQIVLLTFDDGINIHNIDLYRELYNSKISNPNGCPIKSTFFVSGDNTDYRNVKEIYDSGHEIASHSLSHRFPIKYWTTAGYEGYKKEIVGMKKKLAKLSNIAENDIRGMRVPFLQIGGNGQYKMLKDYGFTFDSSMVTGPFSNTGKTPIWPFTLDYPVKPEYCSIPPCPTKSYPGLWEIPIIRWYDNNNRPCSMADNCPLPLPKSKAKTLKFFRNNFLRHYTTNRAPFGIFLHATWFNKTTYNFEALKEFLMELSQMRDVWILTVSQALNWIQNPTLDLSQVRSWKCPGELDSNTAIKACNWPSNPDCSLPPTTVWDETVKKGPCNPKICRLPTCKCPGTEIPGSLNPKVVPQIVLLTFDDGINIHNIKLYRKLYNSNISNPNGCPIKSTFFVSGDNTNYRFVKEIYDSGHEIASHSLSHRFPIKYWTTAGYEGYKMEIVGMKKKLAKLSNIAENDIRGMRVPFLQIGGNDQYKMLKDYGFTFDSSMVTGPFSNTGKTPIWPFTLDYPVKSEYCSIPPCPTKSYPGLWEIPLIRWYDNNNRPCSMADACPLPLPKSKAKTLKIFRNNFRRHYTTNRAPFGICLHAKWFNKTTYNFEALKEFLMELSQTKDVWILTVSQALNWIQNPTSDLSQVRSWNC